MAISRAERDALPVAIDLPDMPEGYYTTYDPEEHGAEAAKERGFTQGNEYWKMRSTHGVKPKFANPIDLLDAAIQYLNFVNDNPFSEMKVTSYEGEVKLTPIPVMRVPTIIGLTSFIGVAAARWADWRKTRNDLAVVITYIDQLIYDRKFSGAASGFLNPGLIIRDLGLTDRQEVSNTGGGVSVNITLEMSPEEAAQSYADTIKE